MSLTGIFRYKKNINDCYSKKKIVDNDLGDFLKAKTRSYIYNYPNNKGKSDVTDYEFSSGFIRTWCTDYSKNAEKKNFIDHFGISITPQYYLDWITNDAHK